MSEFHRRTELPVSAQALFDWHARPGAFWRLAPPWETMSLVRQQGSIQDGDVLVFRVHQGPVKLTWEAHHDSFIPGRQFRDVQKRGPFSRWAHTHGFEPGPTQETSWLDDRIEYRLPLHPLSAIAQPFVRRMLDRMFTFRHERTMNDLTIHQRYAAEPPLDVAITGASGLIGGALTPFLTTGGHTVTPVVRRNPGPDNIFWKPSQGEIDAAGFEGKDVVIHLAGAGVADERWTPARKQMLMDSRKLGTRLLSETLAGLDKKPRVLLSASAIGYYGDRGDEVLNEHSTVGDNYLAEICRVWEEETRAAEEAGIRVVHMRIGLVLDPSGGVLGKMLTPFKMGAGGKLGSGKQFMSWISIDDILGAMLHCIHTPELSGPVNFVGPDPMTNIAFTKTLGKVLSRPTFMAVPEFALKTAFGAELTREALLASQRVLPQRLQDSGYEFLHPELPGALKFLLGA